MLAVTLAHLRAPVPCLVATSILLSLSACTFPGYELGSEPAGGSGGGGGGNPSAGTAAGGGSGEAGSRPYYGSETLLGYYRFDEGPDDQAVDSSGHGHHGTLSANPNHASPTWAVGKVGGALSFEGEGFVRLAYTDAWNRINAANACTVAAWTYRQAIKDPWAAIVSRQYNATNSEHFGLSFKAGRAYAAIAELDQICEASTVAALDTWVHLALVYDGASVRIYEGGAEICSAAATKPMNQDDLTNGVIIGGNVNSASATVEETFVGQLDELVIYSRALTPAEIADLAAAKPPPAE